MDLRRCDLSSLSPTAESKKTHDKGNFKPRGATTKFLLMENASGVIKTVTIWKNASSSKRYTNCTTTVEILPTVLKSNFFIL